jgi:hypothetical protein
VCHTCHSILLEEIDEENEGIGNDEIMGRHLGRSGRGLEMWSAYMWSVLKGI